MTNNPIKLCSFVDKNGVKCVKRHGAKGFCNQHYIFNRYHNDPEFQKRFVKLVSASQTRRRIRLKAEHKCLDCEINIDGKIARCSACAAKENEDKRKYRRKRYATDEKFRIQLKETNQRYKAKLKSNAISQGE